MRVAIVHYWLTSFRGGEKVVKALLQNHPHADLYTLFADRELVQKEFPGVNVYSCFFDFGWFRKHYQKLFPLYPLFVWSLRLKASYDLVISSESGPAKGVKMPKGQPHLCYVHTPMRYAWGFTHEYLRVLPKFVRPLAWFFFQWLRLWDSTTVSCVTHWVANSQNVANRVAQYYQRQAVVVYPPIEPSIYDAYTEAQNWVQKQGRTHFVCFGALVPYKRIDLAVQCFNQNGLPLLVYGLGSEYERIRAMAAPNVHVCGALPSSEFVKILATSRALIFPGEEDFGMIPVEVMALGTPVIAYGKGGALETVLDSGNPKTSTGLFFEKQSVDSMQQALNQFMAQEQDYQADFIHQHAQQFSEAVFLEKMKEQVKVCFSSSLCKD